MNQEVLIQFNAQDQGVIAHLAKQNAELLKNQERLIRIGDAAKKAAKESRQGADEAANGWANVATVTATAAAGFRIVEGAIRAVTAANKEAMETSDAAALKLDTLRRAAMVATNLRGTDAENFATSVESQSIAAGVTPAVGYETAIQMASSGFSNEQITGGGLRDFLNIQTAQRLANKEADATGVVSSTTQLLNAQGKPATGENVRALGVAVQNLKDTPLVFADLQYLAKEMGALKEAGLSDEEALTSFAQLRNTLIPTEAGSGLRNIAQRLAGANAAKDRVAALKELGLTPDDVNMVGESFTDVIKTMRTAFQNVPEEKKNGLLQTLFESAGVAPAAALMQGREQILGYQTRLTDPTMFNSDIAVSQGGLQAQKNRQEAELERLRASRTTGNDAIRRETELLLEQNIPFAPLRDLAMRGYDFTTYTTGDPQAGVRTALMAGSRDLRGAFVGGGNEDIDRAQAEINRRALSRENPGINFAPDAAVMAELGRRQLEATERQNKLVEEQNKLLERLAGGPAAPQARPTRDPGQPPGKRPSSALAK